MEDSLIALCPSILALRQAFRLSFISKRRNTTS
jgi:hypothetical protein